MDLLDKINRFMYDVGTVIYGERRYFPDLFGERQKIVNDAMEREYSAALEAKEKEFVESKARIADLTAQIADLEAKIRCLELKAPKEGDPSPPVVLPRTNGGRIRAMTNAELAAFLAEIDTPLTAEWLSADAE